MRPLIEYKAQIMRMNVFKKGNKTAPHKAILLLAVLELIERGIIRTPFIPLSDELIRAFNAIWYWQLPDTTYSRNFSYPFYHLHSSPFWELVKAQSYVGQKEYSSMTALKRDFIGAEIDNDLFVYLTDRATRDEIRQLLIDNFLTDGSDSSPLLGMLTLLYLACAVA